MKIGKYSVSVLESGRIKLDGGAMFGVVPKPFWNKSNPADEKNRITLATRTLLLESDSKKILIDTGIGENWDEKFKGIYGIDHTEYTLVDSLKNAGLSSEDITDVLITHFHFDHTGGAVILKGDELLPAFPNADYYVQKKHFEWALDPSPRDKASFVQDRFFPLLEESVLTLLDDAVEFDDEITLMQVNGHTFSQQLIKISDASNTLLFCADLIPTSSHVPVPYVMGYDLQPLVTVKEKLDILPVAVEENWTLIYEHDPFCCGSKVGKNDRGFFAENKITELK